MSGPGLTEAQLTALCPAAPPGERARWRHQLNQYAGLLAHWARRVSLVAVGDLPHLGERHLAPALRLRPLLLALPHARVLDVGSGNGLPALPLKITVPSLHLTLVESRRRRCSFLREAVRVLGLEHVDILHQRLEAGEPGEDGNGAPIGSFGPGLVRGRHTVATVRAVSVDASLLASLRPWLAPGAFLISTLPPRRPGAGRPPRLLLEGAATGSRGQPLTAPVQYGVWRV